MESGRQYMEEISAAVRESLNLHPDSEAETLTKGETSLVTVQTSDVKIGAESSLQASLMLLSAPIFPPFELLQINFEKNANYC